MTTPTSAFDQLVQINLGDICESLDLRRTRLSDAVFALPARRFASQMVEFDRRCGESGLRAASEWLCQQMVGRVVAHGTENIPREGATLIVSNHPGLSDTVDLFASIPRDDLLIVANHRPILVALPHVSQHLLYVHLDASKRMSAFRDIVTQLKNGRCVLTFPAGKIEPDPHIRMDDARAHLTTWIESIGLLAKLAPQTKIVPAIVSGVFTTAAYDNPLAKMKSDQDKRERMAAMLQIMFSFYQRNTVQVRFGRALDAGELARQHADAPAITRAIADAALTLM